MITGLFKSLDFRVRGHSRTLRLIYAGDYDHLRWPDAVKLLRFLGVRVDSKNGNHTYLITDRLREQIQHPNRGSTMTAATLNRLKKFMNNVLGITPENAGPHLRSGKFPLRSH
jgi:hypothetical protein